MTSELLLTDIAQTFEEHEIILTGANGFLGKVVLGLILDRFPDFKHLHVLLRPARNASAHERFRSETLASPALAAIAEKRGKDFLRSKITVWPGDISRPYCGIEPADLEKLAGRAGLIINCAGRVDFFPPIDDSFSSNVDGVERLVSVAKVLGAKLLHVSTCYVCGEADGLIEETEPIVGFYPRRNGPGDTSFCHTDEIRYCRERVREITESGGLGSRPRHSLPGRGSDDQEGGRSSDLARRLVALGRQRAERWGQRHKLDADAAREEVTRRMMAQAPEEAKIQAADYVIDNSGSVEETRKQVQVIYETLRTQAVPTPAAHS